MHLFASRLYQRRQENSGGDAETGSNEEKRAAPTADGGGGNATHNRQRSSDIKSPSQLLQSVEQMHKEELDALLAKLQSENK